MQEDKPKTNLNDNYIYVKKLHLNCHADVLVSLMFK